MVTPARTTRARRANRSSWARGSTIEFGPTKHSRTQGLFLYVFEPGGNRVEVFAGGIQIYAPVPQAVEAHGWIYISALFGIDPGSDSIPNTAEDASVTIAQPVPQSSPPTSGDPSRTLATCSKSPPTDDDAQLGERGRPPAKPPHSGYTRRRTMIRWCS